MRKGQQTVLSAKLSPANSMSGLKITNGGDPTNKSVIEDHFKDNDSLHEMNPNHRRHKSNRIVKPIASSAAMRAN